jgi:hypothetical protein
LKEWRRQIWFERRGRPRLQTVVLPSDDLDAYQEHCAQFHTELKPQGLLEDVTAWLRRKQLDFDAENFLRQRRLAGASPQVDTK